jgi:hypothetical protein
VRGLNDRGADNRRNIGARDNWDNRDGRNRSRDSSVTVRRVGNSGDRRKNRLVTSGLLRSRDRVGGLLVGLGGRSRGVRDLLAGNASGHDRNLRAASLGGLAGLGAVGGALDDGDGGSRRGSSGRLEGLGGASLAWDDSGKSVGDGGDRHRSSMSRCGHGRDSTSLSGRANVGALDDGRGNDLLGVASRAVDDGGSTARDGVDVSRGESAGDIANGAVSMSRSGDDSRSSGDRLGGRSVEGRVASGLRSRVVTRGVRESITLRSSLRSSRDGSKRDSSGLGLVAILALLLNEETSRATVGHADLGLGSSSKLDGQGRSEAEVEDVANLDIEINSETEGESDDLVDGDNAVVGGDKSGSVLEKADPDSNLGTGFNVENGDVELSFQVDFGSETETKLEVDSGGEIDISSDTEGKGLGDKSLEGNIDDVLGEKRDLDESLLAESKVDTSRKINSSVNTDNKVKSKSSTRLSLKKAGDLDIESRGSKELNGLVDSSRGRDVDLDVGLDSTKTNADARLLEETLDELKGSITLDLSLGEVKTKLDSRARSRGGGGDTLEQGVVLPAVGERASRNTVGLGLLDSLQRVSGDLLGKVSDSVLGRSQVNSSLDSSSLAAERNIDVKTKTDTGQKVRRGLGNGHETSQSGKQAREMHIEESKQK